MGKRGPKAKQGKRWPSGDLRRPTVDRLNAMAAEQRQKEQRTVLDQPHRRGQADPLAESPIGRLALRHSLRKELYNAGLEYADIVRKWRNCWGAPREVGVPGTSVGSGEGPTTRLATTWRTQMLRIERAMMDAGGIDAVIAVQQLVLVIADTAPEQDADAITGLSAVAAELGHVAKTLHPFRAG